MPDLKAVVFDLDGVLVDARDWHYQALNRALSLFGFPISRFDHLVTYDGLPTGRKLELLSRERGLPAGLHPFLRELKQAYTLELVYAKCKPTFAHEYALSRLKADGYRLAVASNAVRETVGLVLEKTRLAGYVEAVVSNQDVRAPKPDPEIYLAAAERLGVAPTECLAVEDNAYGVKAAEAAGAAVLVVRSPADVTYDALAARLGRPPKGGKV